MRVLFSSTWGLGHVFPMVPLARAFTTAGHTVRWVAHEPAVHAVRAAGIDVVAGGFSGPQVRDVVRGMMDLTAPLPPPQRAAVAFREMFAAQAAPAMLADLLPACRDWSPDLLVHEPAELAAPLVGSVLGIDCVTHSWGPAIPAEILAGAGEELAGLWQREGRDPPPFAGSFASGYLDLCPPAVQYVPVDHIPGRLPLRPVLYSGEDLEPDVDGPFGPVGTGAGGAVPLVYVTLGTVFLDASVLQLAVDAAVAAGARVVATVGPQGDPALIQVASEVVQVRRWVPQAAILPRSDLVVSHAGSGTFLGALSAGLPQLCLPQAADQFRNAHAAVSSGTGLALAPDQVTPEAVLAAIEELLGDSRYREAAAEVATQIAGMPDPADLVLALAGGGPARSDVGDP